MTTRPGGSPPLWASDPAYAAGPAPWDGTPTKVNPGAAYIAAGFIPGEGLPAQVINWLLNAVNPWLGYQDTLEVRTWTAPAPAIYFTGHDLVNALQDNVMTYDADNAKYFIGGQDIASIDQPLVLRSSDGVHWQNDTAPRLTPNGSAQTYQVCWGPGHGVLGLVSRTPSNGLFRRGLDGAWATVSGFTSSNFLTGGIRWFLGRWILVGYHTGNHPGADSFTPSGTTGGGGTMAALTLPGSSGVTLSAFFAPLIDCSPTILIIAAPSPLITAPAAQGDLWVTTDGVTFTHVSGVFQSVLVALCYNPGDTLFYAMCSASGPSTGVCNVYTSPDGITWTLAAQPGPWVFSRSEAEATINAVRQNGPSAALGGAVVVKAQFTTPDSTIIPGLAIGRDAGMAWDFIPNTNLVSTGVDSLCAIQSVNGQLATIRKDDAALSTGMAVSYSLRV